MLEDWKFPLVSRQQAACGKLEQAPALQIRRRYAQGGTQNEKGHAAL
jgi:hypothetical protein